MNIFNKVLEAEYIKDYLIKLKFDNGSVRVVNMKRYADRGGIFSVLKDKEYLKKFFIDLNTLCWPNGADIAPERLYEISEEVSEELLLKA